MIKKRAPVSVAKLPQEQILTDSKLIIITWIDISSDNKDEDPYI